MKKLAKGFIMLLMNQRFFTKIFVSILIVSFAGVFSLVLIYQNYFQKIFMENEMDRVQKSINQAALNLDNQLNRTVQNLYFFYYLNNGEKFIEEEDTANIKQSLEAFRTQYSSEIESAFFIIRDNMTGEETLIYDNNLEKVDDIHYNNHEWYRHFRNKSTELWTKPTRDHLFYQDRSFRTEYLTLGKYGINNRDGMLVIRLNEKLFNDAFRLLAGKDLLIELRDSSGQVVYSSFTSGVNANRDTYVKMVSKLKYSGFEVQAYINKQWIIHKVQGILGIQPLVIVVILLITLLISLVLSFTLVRPIKKLLTLMKKVEIGDLNVRFSSKYTDEIGILGLNFNKMLLNLSALIERVYVVEMEKVNAEMKQKDATLLALQSQINPHFLYNTLEIINCQAILSDVASISRMSKAMADFYRYTIDNPSTEVKLETEIEHVRTYLEIQQERYPDIELDLDGIEPYLQYPIVKLTLQPIVENAFNHAFVGDRDYYLKIYGTDAGAEAYAILIEDNGQGMEEQLLNKMNRLFWNNKVEEPDGEDDHIPQKGNGIGLNNVHQRIRLRYGEGYGLSFQESWTGGVTVRVTLPKEGIRDENIDR